ncbi:hypothetical protein MTO96_050238 [Rhipicephalus appendiculatus]
MPNCLVFAMQALFTIILGWSSCLSSVPVPFQTILPATSTSAPHECAPPIVLALSLDVPIRPPASSTQPSPGDEDLSHLPSDLQFSGHGSSAYNSMPNCLVFAMQALFTIILGWSSCLSSVPVPFQTILPATSTSAPHECAPPIVLALSLDVPIRPPASSTQPSPGDEDLSHLPSDLQFSGHGSSAYNSMPNCLVFAMQALFTIILGWSSCLSSVPVPFQTILPATSTSAPHECAPPIVLALSLDVPIRPPASSTQPSPGDEDLSHLPSDLQFSGHGSSAYNSMPNCLVFAMQALFTIILGWSSCLSSVPVPFQTILPATSTSAPHECAPPIVLALSLDVPIRPPASSTQPSPGDEDLSHLPSDLQFSGHGSSAYNSMPNCLVFAMQALFTIILGWSSCLSSVPVPFQTILPATSTSAPHECAPPIVLALSLDVPIRPPSLIDAAITRRRRFKPPAQRPAIQWTREQCLQQHA